MRDEREEKKGGRRGREKKELEVIRNIEKKHTAPSDLPVEITVKFG